MVKATRCASLPLAAKSSAPRSRCGAAAAAGACAVQLTHSSLLLLLLLQTKDYMRAFFKMCKDKVLPDDVLRFAVEIVVRRWRVVA